jgi:hypothetical protein
MNNKVILPVIGIAIIVAGFMYINYGEKALVIGQDGSIKGEYSLQSIMNLGLSYECTFMKNDGSSNISGAIRIADGSARGDFDIVLGDQDGGSFTSHFIMRDSINYVWTSLQPVGYKTKITKSISGSSSPSEQAQIIGTSDKVNYICFPWNADLTAFKIPSGITFSELK